MYQAVAQKTIPTTNNPTKHYSEALRRDTSQLFVLTTNHKILLRIALFHALNQPGLTHFKQRTSPPNAKNSQTETKTAQKKPLQQVTMAKNQNIYKQFLKLFNTLFLGYPTKYLTIFGLPQKQNRPANCFADLLKLCCLDG